MINIAIIGASGYTGAELTRILSNHPQANLSVATSRQYAGKNLSEVFPHLRTKTDLQCEDLTLDEICERADMIFTAVPHKTAMNIVPQLLQKNKKVIDLSADFRIRDVGIYEEWYQPHSAAAYIDKATYGLPELHRQKIQNSDLVANPGCYPTSIILALAPLLKNNIIRHESIIADSKSGTSGAGRAASVATLYCEVADGFKPYKVASHRHTPEIEQELSLLAGNQIMLSFTPHLLPISRGILSTVYAELRENITSGRINEIYQESYENEPFIRYLGENCPPATQYVRGSNFCDLSYTLDQRTNRIIVMSAIDNIVKGASGQAVQNMNLMLGFDEQEGLSGVPFFP